MEFNAINLVLTGGVMLTDVNEKYKQCHSRSFMSKTTRTQVQLKVLLDIYL